MSGTSFEVGGFKPIDRRYALAIPVVTALPSPARDGDRIQYVATAAATGAYQDAIWNLVYNATAGYWYNAGSSPLVREIDTSESTASAAFTDLATVGPRITVPFVGDYLFAYGCVASENTGAVAAVMSPDFGPGAAIADAISVQAAASTFVSLARSRAKTIATAGFAVTAKYETGGAGTATFSNRFLNVLPLRVH